MVQLSRVHTALTEDLRLSPSIDIGILTFAYDSGSSESGALFWRPKALHSRA